MLNDLYLTLSAQCACIFVIVVVIIWKMTFLCVQFHSCCAYVNIVYVDSLCAHLHIALTRAQMYYAVEMATNGNEMVRCDRPTVKHKKTHVIRMRFAFKSFFVCCYCRYCCCCYCCCCGGYNESGVMNMSYNEAKLRLQ